MEVEEGERLITENHVGHAYSILDKRYYGLWFVFVAWCLMLVVVVVSCLCCCGLLGLVLGKLETPVTIDTTHEIFFVGWNRYFPSELQLRFTFHHHVSFTIH